MNQNNSNSGAFTLTVAIRCLAAGFVFYSLGEILLAFFRGGEEAPSATLLLLSLLVLGGGGVFIALMAWKEWKKNKAALQEQAAEEASRLQEQTEE